MEKVTKLNQVILDLQQQLKANVLDNSKINNFRDKLFTANMSIQDLRAKLKASEESSEKKDEIAKNWSITLQNIQHRIHKVEEENHCFSQERELLKGSLSHVST